MRKKLLATILLLCLCLTTAMPAAWAAELTDQTVHDAMAAMKGQYPEGMPWTNNDEYDWKGGIYSGGFGCAAFAFLLSDAAFGDLPARMLEANEFSYADVRVGDILRINQDTHSVIVLEKKDSGVVIAEGNYNNSIHWGRTLSKNEVMKADYLLTRWPETAAEPETPKALAATQTVVVDGQAVEFQMYALKDENGYSTNYIKLRDLAYVLNGTPAQFDVSYDGRIGVLRGVAYQPNGSEMKTPFSGDRAYTGGAQKVDVNGTAQEMNAIQLRDDQGGGYTYFKLRDLGQTLGFNVGYNGAVFVETDKPYTGAD